MEPSSPSTSSSFDNQQMGLPSIHQIRDTVAPMQSAYADYPYLDLQHHPPMNAGGYWPGSYMPSLHPYVNSLPNPAALAGPLPSGAAADYSTSVSSSSTSFLPTVSADSSTSDLPPATSANQMISPHANNDVMELGKIQPGFSSSSAILPPPPPQDALSPMYNPWGYQGYMPPADFPEPSVYGGPSGVYTPPCVVPPSILPNAAQFYDSATPSVADQKFATSNQQQQPAASSSSSSSYKRAARSGSSESDGGGSSNEGKDVHRRTANNARERVRVHDINQAFKDLGQIIGGGENEKERTKLSILHNAAKFIVDLENMVRLRQPNAACLKRKRPDDMDTLLQQHQQPQPSSENHPLESPSQYQQLQGQMNPYQ